MHPGREGAPAAAVGAPLRVLGWPAFVNRAEQPYNALLYSHMQPLGVEVAEVSTARVLSGRYQVLHLHWPDRRVRDPRALSALARAAALVALLDVAHARGAKNIWTVHNLQAHEGTRHPWLEPRYWGALTARLDGIIALSPSGVAAARAHYPRLGDVPAFIVPHGHLRGVYPAGMTRSDARERLRIPPAARVISFIGQIRAYKNVTQLVRSFRALSDDEVALLIAGRTRPASLEAEIRAAAAGDARIHFVSGFVPDADLQLYLAAADLVVLPYRDILNSGSALLALSHDRPVLVPRLGAMADLALSVGDAWVRTYDGELTNDELRAALAWAQQQRPPHAPLDDLSWDSIARQTVDVYRAVISGSGGRAA